MEISEEIEIRKEMGISEEIEIRKEMGISEKIEITHFNTNDELFQMVWKGEWDKVIDIYRRISYAHKVKITKSGDTALHMAVYRGKEEIAMKLIEEIIRQGRDKETLEIKNDQGNTPLHAAASMGYERMCRRIAGLYPSLMGVGNVDRQTPIFLAAFHDKKEAFLALHNAAVEDISASLSLPIVQLPVAATTAKNALASFPGPLVSGSATTPTALAAPPPIGIKFSSNGFSSSHFHHIHSTSFKESYQLLQLPEALHAAYLSVDQIKRSLT